MIRHIFILDCYALDFQFQTIHFWELKQAERALRKWLKSKSK